MHSLHHPLIALGLLLPSAVMADLGTNLIAYYNFEATGAAGLANQVGGGATHNGAYGSGSTFGVTPAIAGSGSGFTGNAAYEGAESAATTDRSSLLVGNALNIAKSDAGSAAGSGWFNVSTLNAATLGQNFTISAWFFLAPDADNTGTNTDIMRDYVFEASTNFDVSFGTSDADGSSYTSWIGQTAAATAGPLGTGRWCHVAHVFSENGANTELRIYINGIRNGGVLSTPAANMDFTAINFGSARNGARVFDGMIDEVAVWNRALSPNEVTEVHQRGEASLALTADLATAGKAFLSVETGDSEMGLAYGTGLYNINEAAFIDAVPQIGHVFTGWSDPFSAEPAVFDLTVSASVSLTASFAQDTADPDGDGLTNYQELVVYLTDPDLADTDGDTINDGDEIFNSLTNPLVSQLAAVNWISANLGGSINPGDIVLDRNETNNTLTFMIRAMDSSTLATWDPVNSSTPGVSAGVTGGGIRLQIPGTEVTRRFFRISGEEP